ncbi:MAG: glycosyltransferase [Bacteroidales bacterium]|nr:glycosyltransferase [Bacteroidales bacterium]
MTTLVFDPQVEGHHLECLHNLYLGALRKPNHKFIFAVSSEFEKLRAQYEWPKAEHITFDLIDGLSALRLGSIYASAWRLSKVVRRLVEIHKVDSVFLIMLLQVMPFLPFFLPRGVKASGILYNIFLYETRFGQRIYEMLMCLIMSAHRGIERVFVMNDQSAVDTFNRKFCTKTFAYITDPMQYIDIDKTECIRSELNAKPTDKIFLHFGAMDRRKGTLEILDAIGVAAADELRNRIFVFAGRIESGMKADFYEKLNSVANKAHIVVFDKFCDTQFLFNLCRSCDYILMPYTQSYRSSGAIGYASLFGKPVLGPSSGLIGRLIEENNLGITIDTIDGEHIARGINELCNMHISDDKLRKYADTHTVEEFNSVVFSSYK